MELDGKDANQYDSEGTQHGADFDAQPHVEADDVGQSASHAGKGVDLAAEDERHVVHQDVADDSASGSSHGSHRNRHPEGMPQSKRLFDADDVEKGKANGVEDEPGVVVMDDVLAEHADGQHGQGATDEVAAVRHPEGIDTKHEVANRSATDSRRHAHNPCAEDVELLRRGQPDARDGKGKGADELDDDKRDRQPQRVGHVLQKVMNRKVEKIKHILLKSTFASYASFIFLLSTLPKLEPFSLPPVPPSPTRRAESGHRDGLCRHPPHTPASEAQPSSRP